MTLVRLIWLSFCVQPYFSCLWFLSDKIREEYLSSVKCYFPVSEINVNVDILIAGILLWNAINRD